ncbi:GNAT family N-acetyltransferase [Streptomyces hoynatensis]|uniref:GNAT family N-acetyltransferase n=1 Tax=Streptomyces hoynatensis TaxID=1141874 RepID=A0A3A9YNR6_9ACTN|nr:GNAT family N-acetyltransferase [Streptomyces hoynatensis]RKN37642.1 GNAT family N-acetyltransferase [Streptomyces hoynatensis]
MTIELRELGESDLQAWYRAVEWAFGGVLESEEERALWRELIQPERSIAVWDADRIVGSASAFPLRINLPGGRPAPAAGVTMVHVAATHRRRGILRQLMRRELDDCRERGEPLAVLTASEAGIYGRFGYGTAAHALQADIETVHVTVAEPPGTDGLRLRVEEPAAVLDRCEELYARLVPGRPGMVHRDTRWARLMVLDPPGEREGASALRCVLAERDGELAGYARFALKPSWEETVPKGRVLVRHLDAADPAAYAALLRYLCGIDLMATVSLRNRPVDDPLLSLVSDPRRCRPRLVDRLHLRLVDVGAALAARAYAAEVDVVLEVADEFCPWNAGRWRLCGGPKGAVCERTGDAPDLRVSVRALGAAHLGGTSLAALAAAGQVSEVRKGTLAPAATAFGSPVAPWLPFGF